MTVIQMTFSARADQLPGPVPAEVIKIVDGDTIKVRATIWVDQTVEVSVRLRGVDAPELYRPKCAAEKSLARLAKASVAASAPLGSQVTLTGITRDKYGGRVVATVVTSDGETLAARLLAQGQAIAMGTRKPWCGV
ncbi:MAG: thermonuclease family protein [Henriciella sp.]|nr:thermonuclease family protein [Henriciella sp.]